MLRLISVSCGDASNPDRMREREREREKFYCVIRDANNDNIRTIKVFY